MYVCRRSSTEVVRLRLTIMTTPAAMSTYATSTTAVAISATRSDALRTSRTGRVTTPATRPSAPRPRSQCIDGTLMPAPAGTRSRAL